MMKRARVKQKVRLLGAGKRYSSIVEMSPIAIIRDVALRVQSDQERLEHY